MNSVSPTSNAAAFLHRYAGLAGRLPGADIPALRALRDAAAETLTAAGLPSRRLEAWRYTDLAPMLRGEFREALTPVDEAVALPPARADRRAVFVDGRFRADLSSLDGLVAGSLAEVIETVAPRLNTVASASQPMVTLNTLLFEDGLVLEVPAGTDAGRVELLSLVSGETAATVHPRHLIRLARGARLVLLETALSPAGSAHLHNPVFEIEVAEDAVLTHVRVQREAESAYHLAHLGVRVAEGGTYDGFVLNAGGKISRSETHLALLGPRAAAHLNGAQLVANGQLADTTTALDHAAPNCASRQTVKTVLSGRSRGVFQGKILVRREAQKTDGYQMNQALLLSEEAEIDSKPQLEIYADDVKCSHGATAGALDEDSLFYLRSRGIPAGPARAMLVRAFLQEAVEVVADEAAREALDEAVAGWWAQHGEAA
ncbi:Fe-S cluster assembly protein SufD [Pararoseomonas indoligenes]|uniref:Fe-S cluster assembly protein SufD n=1 Tax=Roseomonas indoligenes TaxID=2820811 RepID=A0A940S6V5_9PROT|nr:Fe-S cluster assembly protein SufD [Pararoseomonas indoligenes]MBP0492403.1 Fe-S cluster assembly protein SufD [Pararoseomonas indoligenes]